MSPELLLVLPWAGALACAFASRARRAAIAVAGAVLAASLLTSVVMLGAPAEDLVAGGWPEGIGIRLRADAAGLTFAAASAAILLAVFVAEVRAGACMRWFPATMLLLSAGLTGAFVTADAFNFYVFFELSMITSFVLAAHGRGRSRLRAVLMFSVVNLTGSLLLLLAIGGLYRAYGTLDMDALAAAHLARPAPSADAIAAFGFAGFAIKLGLIPFHLWVRPVYPQVRPAIAAILGGALTNLGVYGLMRFGTSVLPGALADGGVVLGALGLASALYGSLLASAKQRPQRALAYSAVAQIGFVAYALSLGSPEAYSAAITYALINGLNKAAAFLALAERGRGSELAFAAAAASIAGVPPFAGFWAKLFVLTEVIEQSVPAAAALVAASVLSLLYMFRAHQRLLATPARPRRLAPSSIALALVLAAAGLWPAPLLEAARRASTALGGG